MSSGLKLTNELSNLGQKELSQCRIDVSYVRFGRAFNCASSLWNKRETNFPKKLLKNNRYDIDSLYKVERTHRFRNVRVRRRK